MAKVQLDAIADGKGSPLENIEKSLAGGAFKAAGIDVNPLIVKNLITALVKAAGKKTWREMFCSLAKGIQLPGIVRIGI